MSHSPAFNVPFVTFHPSPIPVISNRHEQEHCLWTCQDWFWGETDCHDCTVTTKGWLMTGPFEVTWPPLVTQHDHHNLSCSLPFGSNIHGKGQRREYGADEGG